ncbi:MAG TPA: NrsF family protein, partial [Devosia sp.]|nr:NrsF family protein [Devosia sp.]
MTDDLISRLAGDLKPIRKRAVERRLLLALLVGVLVTIIGAYLVLDLMMGRPFGGADSAVMFWTKFGYTFAFGLLGLAAAPVLVRPEGRIVWPLAAAGILALLALSLGTMMWMRAGWSMDMIMGGTAMVCPWLIILAGLPVLAALLAAMRALA